MRISDRRRRLHIDRRQSLVESKVPSSESFVVFHLGHKGNNYFPNWGGPLVWVYQLESVHPPSFFFSNYSSKVDNVNPHVAEQNFTNNS